MKIIFHLLLLLTQNAIASDFYEDSERGWYYYEQQQKKAASKTKQSQFQSLDVMGKLDMIKQELEYRKASLVIHPTLDNARKYIEFQNTVFNNASEVSRIWQVALLKYPELDNKVKNPINAKAIEIKHAEDSKDIDRKIIEFAKNFELILFKTESCSYCKAFMPVIVEFVSIYNFKILHLDINSPIAGKLNVTSTPTLIAYNKQNNIYLPVARGFTSFDELKNNIILIYNNITNHSQITN